MMIRFAHRGSKPLAALAAALALLASAPLHARLPPLTPEQQDAAAAKKAKEAEQAKEQADAVNRVQDQLAARFGKGGAHSAGGATSAANVPQKAAEAPGTAGPHGGTAPSAEAHSGEAARK